MSDLAKLISEREKPPEERNKFFPLKNVMRSFLTPLLENGDKFAQVFTIIVYFHITLSHVDVIIM